MRLSVELATGICRPGNVVAISERRSFVDCDAGVSGDEGDTMVIEMNGSRRYRWRTWLRGRLPAKLADLLPKGAHDCGAHEWYRADERTWRCYHCEPAVTSSSPWTREEHLQRTLGGIDSMLRMLTLRGELRGERELGELRRLVGEALAVWPEEEQRLERLASAAPAELPGLVHALGDG
jgi:hypothetical protein